MDFEQIKELIKLLQGTNISEFKFEQDGQFVSIRTKDYFKGKEKEVIVQPSVMPAFPPMGMGAPMMPNVAAPQANVAAAPEAQPEVSENKPEEKKAANYMEIKSPMVGTFYRASSPEKGPYVQVGDVIAVDDNVCLVEAMKLFNEVKSEVAGRIVKVLVEDASPVEYDQVLFLVEPL